MHSVTKFFICEMLLPEYLKVIYQVRHHTVKQCHHLSVL
jgi:hypothetical protein